MISGPKPGEPGLRLHYVYDAWNRLAKVFEDTDDDGQYEPLTDEPVAAYEYDGANRRIEQLTDFVDDAPTVATHYFLSAQNQVLETREGSPATAPESLGPKYQNVWSPRYVDSLVLRDTYSGGVLQPASRLFYLADANYNVTALVGKVSETWQVVERYLYAAYGRATVLDPSFLPDANNESDFANATLYTGRELDAATGLYYYRARYYDSELGRFVSRDPMSYRGSKWNLYEYVGSIPVMRGDPTGLETIGPDDPIWPDPTPKPGPIWQDPKRSRICKLLRKRFEKAGLLGPNDFGFTTCWQGKSVWCKLDDKIDNRYSASLARQLMHECVKEHELRHTEQLDCTKRLKDPDCNPYLPGYQTNRESECDAHKREFGCIAHRVGFDPGDTDREITGKILAYCKGDRVCAVQVIDYLTRTDSAVDLFCPRKTTK